MFRALNFASSTFVELFVAILPKISKISSSKWFKFDQEEKLVPQGFQLSFVFFVKVNTRNKSSEQ